MSVFRRCAVAVVILVVILAPVTAAQAEEATFSVAISMKDAVEELGRRFMAARPGVTLRYNLGSSGELQKQIEAAAPVDLFISAAQLQMDNLEKRHLIVTASRRVFARNCQRHMTPIAKRQRSSYGTRKVIDVFSLR